MKWIVFVLVVGLFGWLIYRGAMPTKFDFAGFGIGISPPPTKMCMDQEAGFDRVGSDYNGGAQMSNLQQCNQRCLDDNNCKAYSFNKSSSQCWMKSAPGLRKQDQNYMSAVKSPC